MVLLRRVVHFSLFAASFIPVLIAQTLDDQLPTPAHPDTPGDVTELIPSRPKGLCRDGWSSGAIQDFSGVEIPICIRVNQQPQTWSQAQETCRKDYGFLLKLDSPAKINNANLLSYLAHSGIRKSWTGLHTYAEHLAWDDLIPNTVRPLNHPKDPKSRPWKWDTKPLPKTSEFCGSLNVEDDDKKRRRKRAPDEDSSDGFDLSSFRDSLYKFRRPATETFLPTAAFQSMLSRTQFTDQLPELPGTSLGIQSDHQIPGTGLTDTNLQSGGLHTEIPTFDISSDDREISSSDNSGTTNIMQSDLFATESPLSQSDLLNSVKDIAEKLTGAHVQDSNTPLGSVNEIHKDFNDFASEKDKVGDNTVLGENPVTLGDLSDKSAQELNNIGISKTNGSTGDGKKIENINNVEPTKTTVTEKNMHASAENKTDTTASENTDNLRNSVSSSTELGNTESDSKIDDFKENVKDHFAGSIDNLDTINTNSEVTETKIVDPVSNFDDVQSVFQDDIHTNGLVNNDNSDDAKPKEGLLADIIETTKDLFDPLSSDGKLPEASDDTLAKAAEMLQDMSLDMISNKEDNTGDDITKNENAQSITDHLPEIFSDDSFKSLDTLPIVTPQSSDDVMDNRDKLPTDSIHESASDINGETVIEETENKGSENEVLNDKVSELGDPLIPVGIADNIETTATDETELNDKLENIVEGIPPIINNEPTLSDISEQFTDYMEVTSSKQDDLIKTSDEEDITDIINAENKVTEENTHDSVSMIDDLNEINKEEYSNGNNTSGINEESITSGIETREFENPDSILGDDIETNISDLLDKLTVNETHDDSLVETDIENPSDDISESDFGIYKNEMLDDIPDASEKLSTVESDEGGLYNSENNSHVEVDDFVNDLLPNMPETDLDEISNLDKELLDITDDPNNVHDSERNEIIDDLSTDDIEIDTPSINEFADITDENQYENDHIETPDFEIEDEIHDRQERPDLAEDIQTGNTKTLIHRPTKQTMELSSCTARLPSVCFSYEVEVMSQASTCDDGWYGHVLFDSCYKILDIRLPYSQSVSTCKSLQARVALGESDFERNFILLAVKKERGQLNGEKFWMEATPSSMGCKYFDEMGVLQMNCDEIMNVVCVKDAKSLSVHTTNNSPLYNDEGLEMYIQDAELKLFSLRDPRNSLVCDLTSAASEFPVLWFKDGVLVETRDKYVTNDISLHINESLADAVRTVTNRNISMTALQGRYWCEVWDRKTLSRKRSKPYDVRFSDVISYHGSVQLGRHTKREQMLFNMMNEEFPSVTDIDMDLKTLFKDAIPNLRPAFPDVIDVFTIADRVRSVPSVLEYHTYYTLSRDYTSMDESSLYSRLKAILKTKLANARYIASLPRKTPVSTFRTMSLQSTVSCPAAFLQTDMDVNGKRVPNMVFQFPHASLGEFANSLDNCSMTNSYPGGTARCLGDFYTGAYWGDVVANDCIDESFIDEFNVEIWGASPFTDKLSEIAKTVVKPDNVDKIVSQVAHITEVAAKLTPTDINKIADVLDHTTQIGQLPETVGADVLKTVDKLMASSEKEVHVANIETKAANRIIKSLERFAEQANLGDKKNVRMVSDNVVVEVWDLTPNSEPVIGLAAESGIKTADAPFKDEIIATVFNKSQLAGANVDAAIELPREVFDQKEKGVSLGNRLTMMVFRKSKLFRAALSSEGKILKPTDQQLDKLNSYVISASIAGKKLTGLKERVRTIFRPIKDHAGTQRCVWWDFELNNMRGGWSQAGCYYDGKINGRDICLCDHLTNFAVLIDFYGQAEPIPDHHELSLSIITVLGLACSILGLSLTIISYVFFKKLRQGRAQQTLFNLSLALLFSMLVFLVGIKQTHNYVGCLVVAIMLHYFILASFMWMLMEAILQYLTFVKILGTYITRFTLKTVLPAWGLPLVPVIAVLSIDYHLYHGGPNYCWMDLPAFYFAFAIPVACIISINIVIFFITIVSIFRRGKGLRSNQKKQKMAMTNLQAAITSFILLGLTWVFGYLAISDARLPFQYVFTILNSLQGFFIFILFVVRKKKVRDQWYIICCKAGEKDRVSRSLSASNSIPSSYSNGSNRNSRNSRNSQHERDRSDSTKTTQSTFSNSSGGFTNYGYDNCYEIPYNRHGRRFRQF